MKKAKVNSSEYPTYPLTNDMLPDLTFIPLTSGKERKK